LSHAIHAKTAHGVHSPFVYTLLTEVIRGKYTPTGAAIEAKRIALCANNTPLVFEDLGAGSLNHGSGIRRTTVSALAQRAARQRKSGELLYRLVRFTQPRVCLEYGTNVGIGALYIMSALPQDAVFKTIEGVPAIATIARQTITEAGFDAACCVERNFYGALAALNLPILDFVLLDGSHSYEATLKLYAEIAPKMAKGGLLIIDDIHWSAGMSKAWAELIQRPEVSLSIDVYQFGLLFFGQNRAKEHFRLYF
jgi:predicted O-methyltransferase YrrM